jgi:hypothetical protein
MRGTALRNDIARTAFTLAALGGHAKFELDFVESHARPHVTCDFTVGDSAADANDHGGEGSSWLAGLVRLIINTNLSHFQ